MSKWKTDDEVVAWVAAEGVRFVPTVLRPPGGYPGYRPFSVDLSSLGLREGTLKRLVREGRLYGATMKLSPWTRKPEPGARARYGGVASMPEGSVYLLSLPGAWPTWLTEDFSR